MWYEIDKPELLHVKGGGALTDPEVIPIFGPLS
jgi:hypothetical protein